jgi:serine/threonine protein kinase
VALKELNNSQQYMNTSFLQEIIYYKLTNGVYVTPFYGISRNPKSKNYVMVMNYLEGGDLRKFLESNYEKLNFESKLMKASNIATGLVAIHKQGLVHKDLHPGNVLSNNIMGVIEQCFITDLGLCQPVNDVINNKVYGFLPYLAPEILKFALSESEKKNKSIPHTQASDIYSFGIMIYELFSGLSPYYDLQYDQRLAQEICQGLRPNLDALKIPQLLENLIKKCWDSDPENRPTAEELSGKFIF